MAKIEIEHRGLLTKKKFEELLDFFHKNGKFLGKKERFSIIYIQAKNSVAEDRDCEIDLKLRITNKLPELALKYGKWSGKDARKEFNLDIKKDQFWECVELLKILGYERCALMANTKNDFLYKNIEFSLVEVPDWGYYFEAEILADPKDITKYDKLIEKEVSALGLKVASEEEFVRLLDELNSRPGSRLEINDKTIKELRSKYADYF